MTWTPISLPELESHIRLSASEMTDVETRFWRAIAIHPEKWSLPPWGDEGGGFWVVATAGKQCIYYNDIEDGFNVSEFAMWGHITKYWCNQDELHWIIHRMAESITGVSSEAPSP